MNPLAIVVAVQFLGGIVFAQAPQPQPPAAEKKAVAEILGKAVVLGKKATEGELIALIAVPLWEQFFDENKLEPTEQEIDQMILGGKQARARKEVRLKRQRETLQKELQAADLIEHERQAKESDLRSIEEWLKNQSEFVERDKDVPDAASRAFKRRRAAHTVKNWKVNKALYAKYGGRVIFQEAGVEPVDAYRDFLKEHERKGSFRILDEQTAASFWRYFTDDSMHTFVPPDKAAKAINVPWWLSEDDPEADE